MGSARCTGNLWAPTNEFAAMSILHLSQASISDRLQLSCSLDLISQLFECCQTLLGSYYLYKLEAG